MYGSILWCFIALVVAAPAHARAPWLGVMADGPLIEPGNRYDREWRRIGASGVGFVRSAFYWDEIEPDGPGAAPDWRATDRLVGHATRGGVAVLPVVVRAPAWATDEPDAAEPRPRDPDDYARLMVRLIRRYGAAGTFWRAHPHLTARPIRAWQIWNEPNIRFYWDAADWAPGYARLLRGAHDAIKAEDAGATVVMAGLTNDSPRALRRLYAAGARGSFDVAAAHVYAGAPSGFFGKLGALRRVLDRHERRRVPLWLTEFGWPASLESGIIKERFARTTWGQAERVEEVLPRLARERGRLGVQRAAFYTWASRPNNVDWPTYAGLRRIVDGRLVSTAAYGAFVSVVRAIGREAARPPRRSVGRRAGRSAG